MRLLLLLLLLTISGQVIGQEMRPATQPDPAIAAQAMAPNADTVAAIHRLFAAKRKVLVPVVGGTVLVAVAGAVVALSAPRPSSGGSGYGSLGPALDSNAIAATGIGILSVPVVLLEVLCFGGWGQKHEQQAVEAWQQHRLPSYITRRLKARYF
jgi:hypothetical protein